MDLRELISGGDVRDDVHAEFQRTMSKVKMDAADLNETYTSDVDIMGISFAPVSKRAVAQSFSLRRALFTRNLMRTSRAFEQRMMKRSESNDQWSKELIL